MNFHITGEKKPVRYKFPDSSGFTMHFAGSAVVSEERNEQPFLLLVKHK
jgi:hypothetical protein